VHIGTGTLQNEPVPQSADHAKVAEPSSVKGSQDDPIVSAEAVKTGLDASNQIQHAENDSGAINMQNGQAVSQSQYEAAATPAKAVLGVSKYEQARRQRMQENFEKLRSLGLSGGVADVIRAPAPTKKRPTKRKSEQAPRSAPLRRSTRSRVPPSQLSVAPYEENELYVSLGPELNLVIEINVSSLQAILHRVEKGRQAALLLLNAVRARLTMKKKKMKTSSFQRPGWVPTQLFRCQARLQTQHVGRHGTLHLRQRIAWMASVHSTVA
jgi:hypothetical protein